MVATNMEKLHSEQIEKNLPKLIKHTDCSDQLIGKLLVANVLNTIDVFNLRITRSPTEKAHILYNILLTRKGSFNFLVKSLHATGQHKALHLLKMDEPLSSVHGNINYDKKDQMVFGRLGSELYRGTFAGRDVAVKVINTDIIEKEMALCEIRFLKLLRNHENIVHFFAAETKDKHISIALELCHTNLYCLVKQNHANILMTEIMQMAASGIAYLHKHNVIHRSLMPANVLVKGSQVKISNFMFSVQIPTGKTSVDVKAEIVSGFDWTPPEVFNHFMDETCESPDVTMATSSDIFLLGCIFFFALTKGSHPFGSSICIKANLLHDDPQLDNASLEAEWKNRIRAMISRNPDLRPTAEDILSSGCFHSRHEKEKSQSISLGANKPLMNVASQSEERRNVDNTDDYRNDEMTNKGENSLFHAILAGSPVKELVKIIGDGADWKIKNKYEQTVVHAASECGNVEAIKYFAGLGANLKSKDVFGEEPIHKARFTKCNFIETIHTLVDYGANINARNEYGNTTLGLAVFENRSKYELEYIVQKGGDWRIINTCGSSVLDLAISSSNADAIKYFVALGLFK